MAILVTGGNGFVMSNFVRNWLEADARESVVVLDASAADEAAKRFFAPVADRIRWLQADISKPETWADQVTPDEITHVVHGAAVTPHPYRAPDDSWRDPERDNPRRIIEANLMGSIEMLEWARSLTGLRRFVYVSTGSVYGDVGPGDGPLPEDGHVDPATLYGISKLASELVVRRYGQLFGVPVVSVRLSSVYGPMDRETPSRHVRCVPWLVAHLALGREELRVSAYEAVGDWIHAADVAEAITQLLSAPTLRHTTYNIAYGHAETVRTLIEIVGEAIAISHRTAPPRDANVVCDPDRRQGQWGAYDISRLRHEFGWKPAPLSRRMREYLDWLQVNEFDRPHIRLLGGET